MTLKLADGTYETIVAPASVERFDAIKVGDVLTARYYDNIVLRVKKPGEKDVDTSNAALTKTPGAVPGATAAKQRTITATITAIDMKIPSITLVGPNNWKYSSKVEDVNALKTVKVGDKLDITWTEALLIGFTHGEEVAERPTGVRLAVDERMAATRVLLADDHTLLLGAFEKLLSSECEVVGTVSDGRELVAAAERLKPDVIVLDIGMPLLERARGGAPDQAGASRHEAGVPHDERGLPIWQPRRFAPVRQPIS